MFDILNKQGLRVLSPIFYFKYFLLSTSYSRFPLADLLPPHGIIQTFFVQKVAVFALLYYRALLQYINAVGVHNRA